MSSSDLTSGVPSPEEQRRRAKAGMAVLEALIAQGNSIVARLDSREPAARSVTEFRSRLRFVDPGRQFILLDASADAAADAALLAQPHPLFQAEWGEWRVEFAAADPTLALHAGVTMIRLRFPDAISSHRHRSSERAQVPSVSPLRCVASVDEVVYFEASVADISPGGVGVLLFGPDIVLEAGTVIRGCQIERAGSDPVSVDLEVRYTGPSALADGSPAQRAGCRFLNPSPALSGLIAEYCNKN